MIKEKDLNNWIVAISNQEELEDVLQSLELDKKLQLKSFPMIVYKGINDSIIISEISNENLNQMGKEKFENRVLWNYSNIKSGLAKSLKQSSKIDSNINLTPKQRKEINKFIKWSNYSFTIEHVLEEYEKFKNHEYVSYSFKKVFEEFNHIFTRELK